MGRIEGDSSSLSLVSPCANTVLDHDTPSARRKLSTTGNFKILPFIYFNFIQSATAVGEKHTTAARNISYSTLIVELTPTKA